MRAVVTVIGRDTVGILAKVAACCAARQINVLEVTQSILQELFVMVMLVSIDQMEGEFADFAGELGKLGDSMGLAIHVMHEDIFNSMHRI